MTQHSVNDYIFGSVGPLKALLLQSKPCESQTESMSGRYHKEGQTIEKLSVNHKTSLDKIKYMHIQYILLIGMMQNTYTQFMIYITGERTLKYTRYVSGISGQQKQDFFISSLWLNRETNKNISVCTAHEAALRPNLFTVTHTAQGYKEKKSKIKY